MPYDSPDVRSARARLETDFPDDLSRLDSRANRNRAAEMQSLFGGIVRLVEGSIRILLADAAAWREGVRDARDEFDREVESGFLGDMRAASDAARLVVAKYEAYRTRPASPIGLANPGAVHDLVAAKGDVDRAVAGWQSPRWEVADKKCVAWDAEQTAHLYARLREAGPTAAANRTAPGVVPASAPPREASSKAYFDMVSPFYIENWPDAICRLSFAQIPVRLSLGEALAVGKGMTELGETFVDPVVGRTLAPGDLGDVRRRVAAAVERFPRGAFVRLGSRSPKDSWSWGDHPEGPKVIARTDPLRFVLDASSRMEEDLTLALANDYAPTIWVREWADVPEGSEFRCFVRKKRLVAISQYQTSRHHPEVVAQSESLSWAISRYLEDVARALHVPDAVCDVFAKVRSRGNRIDVEVRLLEINPYCEMTDPCLFRWDREMPREFRYLNERSEVVGCSFRRS